MRYTPYTELRNSKMCIRDRGVSVAVGMAAAGKYDKKDYRVYTLTGDGEIQEGQIWEAAIDVYKRQIVQ